MHIGDHAGGPAPANGDIWAIVQKIVVNRRMTAGERRSFGRRLGLPPPAV
jgi:hypothetical protein